MKRLYAQNGDALKFEVWTLSAWVWVIEALIKYADGSYAKMQARVTSLTTGFPATVYLPLTECEIVSVTSRTLTGTPVQGQAYCAVTLITVTGSVQFQKQVLYSSATPWHRSLSWPGSPVQSPQDSPGSQLIITPTPPAAGENFEIDVPDGQVWRLYGLTFIFTADATVATRTIQIKISDLDDPLYVSANNVTVTASAAKRISFFAGAPADTTIANTVAIPLLTLPAETLINSLITNIQTGDTITKLKYFAEKWVMV